ncbi:MAG: hypothetical protein GY786_06960, partial [Proteobacteria bacterium]|nr:hypothetical protein [Pseudomonadota bacterium]
MFDKHARTKMTRETFANVRLAILGQPNRYDEYGNPVLGGYVGDVGFLPNLYKREWETVGTDRWTFVDVDGDGINDIVSANKYEFYAQPEALWNSAIGKTVSNWERTYLTTPVDPMPEDQVWEHGIDPEQNLDFLMRESQGALSDGWGRQIVVFTKELTLENTPKNLHFISAGPDGEIKFNDPTLPFYDATLPFYDPTLSKNEDNIVMGINKSDWNFNGHKILATRSKLQKIKEAIIGTNNLVIDGQIQPYGFIADIGNPEPLTGSYVRKAVGSAEIYRCVKTHKSAASGVIPTTSNEYWVEITGWTGAEDRFPAWENDVKYFQ